MYIYNVTTNIEESIHNEWLKWMKEKHIPDMLSTGKFIYAKMSQVMIEEEMGGITYSVQYTADNLATLQNFYKEDSMRLSDEALKRFGGKFVAFSTELKIISEQFNMSVKN